MSSIRGVAGVACVMMAFACGGQEAPMEPGDPSEPSGATQLTFEVQPADAAAGAPLAPAVAVAFKDNQGAVVTSATGAVTLELDGNPTGATLLGTVIVNAVNGVATFDDIALDKAGAGYTLVAGSGNLTSAESAAFAVEPGAPAQLVFETAPSDADLDVVMAPAVAVSVQDTLGNVVTTAAADVTLMLAANPGGATLSGATTKGAIDGVAVFDDLVLDAVAAGYTLTAASGGLAAATSAPFDVVLAFQQVSGSVAVDALVGVQDHTCGVATSGAAYCWGANDFGQLGDGSAGTDSDTPVRVLGEHLFTNIATGYAHSCGVTTDRDAYCWGWNGLGQLGDGSGGDSDTPVLVSGGQSFTTIGSGVFHTCGLDDGGTAYCWGANDVGQLGDGNAGTGSSVPVSVEGRHLFAVLTVGGAHACGATAAGIAGCWGYNDYGQLGNFAAGPFSAVPTLTDGGHTFASLTAGGYHTCGVTPEGDALCWGYNDSGQLGDGGGAQQFSPVPVAGGHDFASLAAGGFHTCGVTTSAEAGCWGENLYGALGDGNAGTNSSVPTLVSGGHTFTRLAGGTLHTCGVTAARIAYCWGRNDFGQLGNGTGVDRSTPVAISNP